MHHIVGDGSAAIVRKEPVAAGPVDNKHLMVDVVVGMGVGVIVDALYLSQQGEAVGGGKDVREEEFWTLKVVSKAVRLCASVQPGRRWFGRLPRPLH